MSSAVIRERIVLLLKLSMMKFSAYVPSDRNFTTDEIFLNKIREFYVLDLQQFLRIFRVVLTILSSNPT